MLQVNAQSAGEATLIVAGIGIEWESQTTAAARGAIERADRVLFAVADPWAARWIRKLNPVAESLDYPRDGRPRRQIYRAMVEQIMAQLRKGGRLCVVFYGHPGVLVAAGHEAIRQAKGEGFSARMLPGVSALDCLFADLGLDPGKYGCQIFEASSLHRPQRPHRSRTPLVLHQVALIDNPSTYEADATASVKRGLERLRARLLSAYPLDHWLILYEAATHPSIRRAPSR